MDDRLYSRYEKEMENGGIARFRSEEMRGHKIDFEDGGSVSYYSCRFGNFLEVEDMVKAINSQLHVKEVTK